MGAKGKALPHERFVVGIGASAGGLEAIEKFFDHTPADTGLSFVVVQHLSPDFKSLMDELLARHTEMAIHQVTDRIRLEPNAIYLIPPKKNIVLEDEVLRLREPDRTASVNLPIDIMLNSLASEAGDRAIAVILSGSGSDGSRGVRAVHEAGGLVVVQTPESAAFDGMPRAAIQSDCADLVMLPAEMPSNVIAYVKSPATFVRGRRLVDAEETDPNDQLAPIFQLFRKRFEIDFRHYKTGTIHRRLERRMQLRGVGDLGEYGLILEREEEELDRLYRDLLVEVTRFFRDPDAFDRLRLQYLPEMLREAKGRNGFRAWTCGCATGEEAYSLAMLIDDGIRTLGLDLDVKVFATDVYKPSLGMASTGVFSAEAVESVPPTFLHRYFTIENGGYRVSPRLREMVVFAPHDITRDTPFTKIDLLSCRNLMIYLNPDAQQRVFTLFHFALRKDGLLFLGSSESLGPLEDEFEVLEKHWKIFRKKRDVRLKEPLTFSGRSLRSATPIMSMSGAVPARFVSDPKVMVFEDLLQQYVPPSLLVNDRLELLHTFGEARKYLSVPVGQRSDDLLRMVDGDLRLAINAAVHRSRREEGMVALKGVRLKESDERNTVSVIVRPYQHHLDAYFLICLEQEPDHPATPSRPVGEEEFDPGSETGLRVMELERDLDFTRASLQSTNEEMVAANEELQSTNEELHSVNEELYTVNAEHQRKIQELTELTADMDNLFRAIGIGIIFLDRNLCIRKFTPAISDAFNVMERDIGRPIDHIAYHLDNPGLLDNIHDVIDSGEPHECEVRSKSGRIFHKRIRPYRSATGSIEGAVLTFTDVTRSRKAEAALHESEAKFREAVGQVRDCIWITNADGTRHLYVNEAFEVIWGRPVGALMADIAVRFDALHPDDTERVRMAFYGRAVRGEDYNEEYRVVQPDGQIRWVQDRGCSVRDFEGRIVRIVGTVIDITESRTNQARLERSITEKECLLQEIHHRVKNNLQVISSILRLQANNVSDAAAKEMFQDCVDRVRVMAQVHERLYRTTDLAAIDMGRQIAELAGKQIQALKGPGQEISLEAHIESVEMSLQNAVPVGLLANEIISNSLKHAFPNRADGHIKIDFRALNDEWVRLEIRDDGAGVSSEVIEGESNGLGLHLIRALCDQIKAELEFETDGGTTVVVHIPVSPVYSSRPQPSVQPSP